MIHSSELKALRALLVVWHCGVSSWWKLWENARMAGKQVSLGNIFGTV